MLGAHYALTVLFEIRLVFFHFSRPISSGTLTNGFAFNAFGAASFRNSEMLRDVFRPMYLHMR